MKEVSFKRDFFSSDGTFYSKRNNPHLIEDESVLVEFPSDVVVTDFSSTPAAEEEVTTTTKKSTKL